MSASARPTASWGSRSVNRYQGSSSTQAPRVMAVRSPCRTAR